MVAYCAVEIPHLIINRSNIMTLRAGALSFFHRERIGSLMAYFAAAIRSGMLYVHRIVYDTL